MKLSDPQWQELRQFAAADDQRGFEQLVETVLAHAEQLRRIERQKSERITDRGRPWIPERV